MITCIEYLVFFLKNLKNCNFETFNSRHEELIGAEFPIYKQLGKIWTTGENGNMLF